LIFKATDIKKIASSDCFVIHSITNSTFGNNEWYFTDEGRWTIVGNMEAFD